MVLGFGVGGLGFGVWCLGIRIFGFLGLGFLIPNPDTSGTQKQRQRNVIHPHMTKGRMEEHKPQQESHKEKRKPTPKQSHILAISKDREGSEHERTVETC